jgi:hypothetical protein
MSETTEYSKQEMFPSLALLSHNFYKTLWPSADIQWLYLAAHGCKTYLNLNLNLDFPPVIRPARPPADSERRSRHAGCGQLPVPISRVRSVQ